MVFTATIAILAAVGSVSAGVAVLPVPTVTEAARAGCYTVSLNSNIGPISAEICGPHEPFIQSKPDGCFASILGNQETLLCRDGTVSSSTSENLAKRSIRPQVRKAGTDCYAVSLDSAKGRIESILCGSHLPQIQSSLNDCFTATVDRTSLSLCMDGTLASSTSEAAE